MQEIEHIDKRIRRRYGRIVIQHGVRPVQSDSGRRSWDILISDQFGRLELMDAEQRKMLSNASRWQDTGVRYTWDDLEPVSFWDGCAVGVVEGRSWAQEEVVL